MRILRWGRKARGFTLIEIAIVVAIIGLLLIISLPLFSGARNRAYAAEGRVILSEAKSLAWACLVEHKNVMASCDTATEIGWSPPTSDTWNTAAASVVVTNSACSASSQNGAVDATRIRVQLNGLSGGPLATTQYICIDVDIDNGKATEVLSI